MDTDVFESGEGDFFDALDATEINPHLYLEIVAVRCFVATSYKPPPLPIIVKREPNDEDSLSFNLDNTIANRDPEVVEIDPVAPHVYEFPRTQSHYVADDMDECSTKGTACAGPLLLTSKSREICETSMGTLPNDADSDRNIEDVPARQFRQFLHYIEVPSRAFIYGKRNIISNPTTEPKQLYGKRTGKSLSSKVIKPQKTSVFKANVVQAGLYTLPQDLYPIPLERMKQDVIIMVTRQFLQIYDESFQENFSSISEEKFVIRGLDMYPNSEVNSYARELSGILGLCFVVDNKPTGKWETIKRVSTQIDSAKWLYMGQYQLVPAASLIMDEGADQDITVCSAWAREVHKGWGRGTASGVTGLAGDEELCKKLLRLSGTSDNIDITTPSLEIQRHEEDGESELGVQFDNPLRYKDTGDEEENRAQRNHPTPHDEIGGEEEAESYKVSKPARNATVQHRGKMLKADKAGKGRPPVVIPSPNGQCVRCRSKNWDDCSLAPEATRCWKCTRDKQRCVWTSKSTDNSRADFGQGRGKRAAECDEHDEETEDEEPRASKRRKTAPIEPIVKQKCLSLRSRVVARNITNREGSKAGSLNAGPAEDDVDQLEELEMVEMASQRERADSTDNDSKHTRQLAHRLEEQRERVVTVRNFSHAMQDDVRNATSNLMIATARLRSAKSNYAKSLKDLAEAERQMESLEGQEARLQHLA